VLEDSVIDALLETVRLTPTSYGLQPFKLFLVTNKETREKLKAASYNQGQVTDASHLVVFAAKKDENEKDVTEYIENISKTRNVPVEALAGFAGMGAENKTAWAAKQAYIGLGTLMAAAALEEIDATPMEGFSAKDYDEILNLSTKGYTAVVIAAIGKRAETDIQGALPKVRKSKEDFIEIVG